MVKEFDEGLIECSECCRKFQLIWIDDGLELPEYCPMCGAKIEYLPPRTKPPNRGD